MKFAEKVYGLTKQIPKGKVSSYKNIAKALNTKAYKAVGNALHVNPYAPIVPCHRVVKSNGDLGVFASGSAKKIRLLESEGIKVKENKIVNFEKVLFKDFKKL
jgi:methylated-DNA-[protein]-cysteine S-methyltransferase